MVLILVIAIFVAFGLLGMSKGIIKITLSLAALVATLIFASIVSPIIATGLIKTTDIDEKLADSVYEIIINNEKVNQMFAQEYDVPVSIDSNHVSEYIEMFQTQAVRVGEQINLPDSLKTAIGEIPLEAAVSSVDAYQNSTLKEIIIRIFVKRMSEIILKAIIQVVLIIIVYIALRIVLNISGIITKLPVINQADKMAGLLVGLVQGLLVVWVLFTIFTAAGNTEWAMNCLSQIESNVALKFIYDNNLIMKLIIK